MPYCTRCGKPVQTEGDLCEDCRNAELIFGEFSTPRSPETPAAPPASEAPAVPVDPADPGTRMDGFPKALTSVILGVVSFILSIVSYVMTGLGMMGWRIVFPILFLLLSVGGVVVSVIFGVKSIMKFADSKRRGKIKPIATLVCGICGCASSGLAALYLFLDLLFLAML